MCTNCVFGTEVETEEQKNRRRKEQKEKRTEGRKEKRRKGQKNRRTEEWKREGFRVRGSLGKERIPDKKGLRVGRTDGEVMLPETVGNVTEDEKG